MLKVTINNIFEFKKYSIKNMSIVNWVILDRSGIELAGDQHNNEHSNKLSFLIWLNFISFFDPAIECTVHVHAVHLW